MALNAVVTDETCPGFFDGTIDLTATGPSGLVTYVWSNGATTEDLASVNTGTYTVTATDASVCIVIDTFVVTDAHGLTVSLGNDTTLCEITNYLLSPVTMGATFYYWQSGAQTTTFLAQTPGSYNVYVQNSFGCFATDTIELSEFPALNVALATTQPGCGSALGALDLSVTGGAPPYDYVWSTGSTNQDLNNLPTGFYDVAITDANNCLLNTNGMILPTVVLSDFSANSSLVCDTDSIRFLAHDYAFLVDGIDDYFEVPDTIVIQPDSNYTLEAWIRPLSGAGAPQVVVEKRILSNDGVSLVFNPLTRQIHARIQNGSDFVLLSSNAVLNLGVWTHVSLVVDETYTSLYINGVLDTVANYTRGTNVVAGTPWRVGGGPARLSFNGTIDEVRLWNVALTPSQVAEFSQRPIPNGFSKLSLYLPFDQAPGAQLVTEQSPNARIGFFVNANLQTAWQSANPMGLTFFWDFGDGGVNNSQTPTHVFPNNLWINANVVLSVTNSQGCASRDTLVLPVHTPANPMISQTSEAPFCLGDSTFLFAQNNYTSYLWSNGSTNDTILVNSTGTYSIVANDGAGCIHADSLRLIFYPNSVPLPVLTPQGTTTICLGDSVTLDVGLGYAAYVWSNGASTSSIVVTQPGSYMVTVANGFGCVRISDTSKVIVLPVPTATISNNGGTLFASVGASYQWFLNGQPILGAISISYVPIVNGSYVVHVGNPNGCDAISQPYSFLVGLSEADFAADFALFPNPAVGDVQIRFWSRRPTTVGLSILDLQGRVLSMQQMRIDQGENLLALPTTSLPAGTYMVCVQGHDQRLVRLLSKL